MLQRRPSGEAPSGVRSEQPVECPNFIVCGAVFPQEFFDSQGGTCTNCAIAFGTLPHTTRGEVDCPVCLETVLGGAAFSCGHFQCVGCFRRSQGWDGNPDDVEPPFPYGADVYEKNYSEEMEMKREEDMDEVLEEWMRQHPLIEVWNREYNAWDDRQEAARQSLPSGCNLCPVCRCPG